MIGGNSRRIAPLFLLLALPAMLGQAGEPPVLDPGDLAGRPDLIGREVIVEGRQPRFDFTTKLGWYQFTFKNTPVWFRPPDEQAMKDRPAYEAIRARGVLVKDAEGRLWCRVSAFEPLPGDLQRLNDAVARVGDRDAARRYDWAAWAFSRAKRYGDAALAERAGAIAAEAARIEGEARDNRAADRQIAIARQGRERGAAEPEPSALAHRGFLAKRAEVQNAEQAEALAKEALAFFPQAANPVTAPADLSALMAAYRVDPAAVYRKASLEARKTLDRQLVADLLTDALQREAVAHPDQGVALADRAARELPDRPDLGRQLREQGLVEASRDLGSLREADVRDLARRYEEELRQPDQARDLLRRWLEDQRTHRLSPNDAEGRLLLADKYEAMLGDKETAAALLREAARIDPESRQVVEAFLKRGFRQVKGEWVAPSGTEANGPALAAAAGSEPGIQAGDPYLGLSREEVRNQLGRPSRVVRVATQGYLLEQWQYRGLGGNNAQFFNFGKRPDQPRPVVIAHGRLD